jgi:dTDP-4-amino-4,6-dideoxygalactose transaminase
MWHLFPIRVPSDLRRSVFEELRFNGIGVQVNYLPAHLQPVFTKQGFKPGDFPISEEFYATEISLPMHANLEILDQKYFQKVSNIIKNQLSQKRI